jgi:hypothetical protein
MLPNASRAIIEPAKLRDYLLSTEHPVGRFKARFFRGLGYTRENWEILRDDLLRLAAAGEVTVGQPGAHGQKYEVSGSLVGPNGRGALVVSIWLIRTHLDAPRFVTAYPG